MDVERGLPADPVHPLWSTSSWLVYVGGFVALFATTALIAIAEDDQGAWAFTAAALLALAVSAALAEALDRARRGIAAGVAATLAVVFAGAFVGGLLDWIGLLDSDGDGYEPALHVVEATLIAAALLAVRRYRAPLPLLVAALTLWLTVVELASHADWGHAEEVASLVVGAALAAVGFGIDRHGRRTFGFWFHAIGGLAAGGALVSLLGDDGWAVVALVALVYVTLGFGLHRSSYAVLGAVGLLVATTMFTADPGALVGGFLPFGEPAESDSLDDWQIAASYLVTGLLLGAIGVFGRMRRLHGSGPDPAGD